MDALEPADAAAEAVEDVEAFVSETDAEAFVSETDDHRDCSY
jgi:hypothetical protein